jgi:cell division protein FtsN
MKLHRGGFLGQRGGFAVGLVVGLLVGLSLALGVALYVTKVPVPFVNKVPQRTAEQDAAEAEKNKNWDPNSALHGKGASAPSGSASTVAMPAPAVAGRPLPGAPAASSAETAGARTAPSASLRDPAAILAGAAASVPIAKVAAPLSTKTGPDPFSYFVQAGAYTLTEDADQQRARLAMLGFEAKLSEREQGGRTMYRVRIGPFDRKDDAEAARDKLNVAGVESALVRVQK